MDTHSHGNGMGLGSLALFGAAGVLVAHASTIATYVAALGSVAGGFGLLINAVVNWLKFRAEQRERAKCASSSPPA